jgi:chemotaxis protein CheC
MSGGVSPELDALREIVNIASGNAANALAMLVGQPTMISLPRVTLEPVGRLASIIGTHAQPTVVVAMQMLGDVTGWLLFVTPLASAHALTTRLLGRPGSAAAAFDEAERSALEETANVIAGAFVGALGRVVSAVVMISVPMFAIEPPDDVLARYRQAAGIEARALCVETSISIGASPTPEGAHLVLLPIGPALESLVRAVSEAVAR